MFGAPDSLKHFSASGEIHPAWGIFPRVAMLALNRMAQQSEYDYVFTCSCVDIYFGQIADLLNERKTCHPIPATGEV